MAPKNVRSPHEYSRYVSRRRNRQRYEALSLEWPAGGASHRHNPEASSTRKFPLALARLRHGLGECHFLSGFPLTLLSVGDKPSRDYVGDVFDLGFHRRGGIER